MNISIRTLLHTHTYGNYARALLRTWYKYQICIGARVLICKDLCDRVMDGGGWSDSHTRWTKSPLSITQVDQSTVPNKKFEWKPYSL